MVLSCLKVCVRANKSTQVCISSARVHLTQTSSGRLRPGLVGRGWKIYIHVVTSARDINRLKINKKHLAAPIVAVRWCMCLLLRLFEILWNVRCSYANPYVQPVEASLKFCPWECVCVRFGYILKRHSSSFWGLLRSVLYMLVSIVAICFCLNSHITLLCRYVVLGKIHPS